MGESQSKKEIFIDSMKVNEILGLVIPGMIILPMVIMVTAVFVKAMWVVFKSIK